MYIYIFIFLIFLKKFSSKTLLSRNLGPKVAPPPQTQNSDRGYGLNVRLLTHWEIPLKTQGLLPSY